MDTHKVSYLKADRGRWFYRRRVPQRHQKTLGIKNWNRPCGDVAYQKAVTLVTVWAEEHDALVASLDNPEEATAVRQATEGQAMAPSVAGLIMAQEAGVLPDSFDPLEAAIAGINEADRNPEFDSQDRLIRYRAILRSSFGSHVTVPADPDRRDEFDMVKWKLERRISDIAGDPNTISAVAEKYFDFAGVTVEVKNKYRRIIRTLVKQVDDIPLPHLTASKMREFRDAQAANMLPTSLSSTFTPIRGMFKYAVGNEIIELNPMPSVQMPKDKRSIQKRKWQPFSPEEAQRLFQAMDKHWGSPMRGLSDERRLAIHMVVRVQAVYLYAPEGGPHAETRECH